VTLGEHPGTVTAEFNRDGIHDFTLKARHLLTEEIWTILEGVYGLRRSGGFEPGDRLKAFPWLPEVRETRDRLQRYLEDEVQAGLRIHEAVEKLVKEVAFTHLNRLVAFKMLEARKLIRGTVDKYQDSNAFKFYLVDQPDDMELYEAGSMPQNTVGEGPRDVAYRHFLLWQCGQLAREINVLFDPTNLPSRLFPRPTTLRQLIEILNAPELADAWTAGNEEAIGWVYQYFNEPDLGIFRGQSAPKVPPELIAAKSQQYTPRWIVKFLVENTLGRHWLQMHPDSELAGKLEYLVPVAGEIPSEPLKPVTEIAILDPACGTMHFGLVAFDLLAEMYKEEVQHAGDQGWPRKPSVEREEDIPAAIIANNLFGIDIDLRAVQLSALTLYLKAKTMNKEVVIAGSNLASANVRLLGGDRLDQFLRAMQFTRPIYERVIAALWPRLQGASQFGSLLRPEQDIRTIVEGERERFRREGEGRLPFPELRESFEEEAEDDAFWEILEVQIIQALDAFAREQVERGQDVDFFMGEAVKGFKLLDIMMRRYDVVVTNPPYLDSRDYNSSLQAFLDAAYPATKRNLYSAFLERCLEFLLPDGRLGIITPQTFMFISSFEKTRAILRDEVAIETLVQTGYNTFEDAMVECAFYVLRLEPRSQRRRESLGLYFRLVKESNPDAKRRGFERALLYLTAPHSQIPAYLYRQSDFDVIPGAPWVYWIRPAVHDLFATLPNLGSIARPYSGMTTSDNFRFVRRWWEVGVPRIGMKCSGALDAELSRKRWFPYMKGGGFGRWYGNQSYVVNWGNDGAEVRAAPSFPRASHHYFQRGVTYSYLTQGRFSARLSPGGFIFDMAGSSLFPSDVPLVLAVMNSAFAAYALALVNPTVNFQVGDIARLPIPIVSSVTLKSLVDRAIDILRGSGSGTETTYEFVAPLSPEVALTTIESRVRELAAIERQIDDEVYSLYGIVPEERAAIEQELADLPEEEAQEEAIGSTGNVLDAEFAPTFSQQEVDGLWVSYAVGIVLGRFQVGIGDGLGRGNFSHSDNNALHTLVSEDGVLPIDPAYPGNLQTRVELALDLMLDEAEARGVIEQATGAKSLVSYFERDFFKDHVQRYGKRPVYWLLQSPRRSYGVYLFHERITKDTLYIIQGNQYLGGKINQVQGQVDELHARAQGLPQGRERKHVERELDQAQNLLTELESFAQALKAVTSATNERGEEVGWEMEIDDGVLINLAPLHALMPAWSAEPKKAWESLRKGEWDWSHTAMRYWPDRVLEKCRTNKSFAIAHERMDVYEGNA
jgi:N-6 DNA Methylase